MNEKNVKQKSTTKKPKLKNKRLLIIILSLLLLLISASLLFIYFYNINKKVVVAPVPETIQEIVSNSQIISNTEGQEAAQKSLDEKININNDNIEKGLLYDQKSLIAYNNGQYQESLDYAKKAEEYNPTTSSAQSIAMNSEKLGDNITALKYYKIQLERAGPPITSGGNIVIEKNIERLSK